MPVVSLIIKTQKRGSAVINPAWRIWMNSPPCFQAVATYLLLLLMGQQNVTLPTQTNERQPGGNHSGVGAPVRHQSGTSQAPAEQVTEPATAALLGRSRHKCRFKVVTSIAILLKDYAISCWHPYWTLLQEFIRDVRTLQSGWSEVVKMPRDPILGQITYTCASAALTPDTWAHLGYLQSRFHLGAHVVIVWVKQIL